MAENKEKQGLNQVQSEGMTGNDGSSGNKDFAAGQQRSGNQGGQRQGGDEALEGNTGVGGSNANQGNNSGSQQNDATTHGQDSDGNTGIMTNDDFEKDEVGSGGDSLRDPGNESSDAQS